MLLFDAAIVFDDQLFLLPKFIPSLSLHLLFHNFFDMRFFCPAFTPDLYGNIVLQFAQVTDLIQFIDDAGAIHIELNMVLEACCVIKLPHGLW